MSKDAQAAIDALGLSPAVTRALKDIHKEFEGAIHQAGEENRRLKHENEKLRREVKGTKSGCRCCSICCGACHCGYQRKQQLRALRGK